MKYVFVALVDVRPQQGCRLLDPVEVNGAMVRCYVPASDETSALAMLGAYFVDQRLDLVATEWLVRADHVEWGTPGDQTGWEPIDVATKTGVIAIAEFHSWSHDAPDAAN